MKLFKILVYFLNFGYYINKLLLGGDTVNLSSEKLLKVGAAAVLSVGLLAACGDDNNDNDDIIIDDPIEQDNDQEDDTDLDLEDEE